MEGLLTKQEELRKTLEKMRTSAIREEWREGHPDFAIKIRNLRATQQELESFEAEIKRLMDESKTSKAKEGVMEFGLFAASEEKRTEAVAQAKSSV